MHNIHSIGVFDSGVGGISVLKEIIKILPHENILYYGDSGNAPYGEKTAEEIQKLCLKILYFFATNRCKAIVIACNTATAAALDILSNELSIPIIGVIHAGAHSAVKITKNNNINILATPFTVNSNSYVKELKKLSKKIKVFQEGCPELCPMIEKGWELEENRMDILKQHINNLNENSDTLILGCTHYPLILEDIKKLYKGNIIDPAKETAKELYKILELANGFNISSENGNIDFFVSGNLNNFKNIAENFLGFEIKNIYHVDK